MFTNFELIYLSYKVLQIIFYDNLNLSVTGQNCFTKFQKSLHPKNSNFCM